MFHTKLWLWRNPDANFIHPAFHVSAIPVFKRLTAKTTGWKVHLYFWDSFYVFFFYYHHKFTFYISCSVLSVFCLDKSCKWVALAMEEGKCCQNQICTLKERWHECLVKGSWCIHQEKSATAWALHTLQKTMWSIKTLIWPRCVKGKKKKFMNSNLTFCRLWRQRHRIFSSPSTPYTTRYFMVLNYWRFLFLKIYILTDFPFMFQVSGVF